MSQTAKSVLYPRMYIPPIAPVVLIIVQEELAVHKRKVQDVRQWLVEAFEGGPSGKLKKYRVRLDITPILHDMR